MNPERRTLRHLGDIVSGYLDGELSASERHRAESHLAGCDHCRDQLTDMMFVRARLRALPMLELPAEPNVVGTEVVPIHRRTRILMGAAAAAVAMVLALAAGTPPGEVVDLSGHEFSMTYGARASLDTNQTGRQVRLVNLVGAEPDSGVNG
jgi:anti-sigma factor RsiW